MKCLDCASFSFGRAKPAIAKAGKGICAHHLEATAYDPMEERDCRQFLKATPEVIYKRERWMRNVGVQGPAACGRPPGTKC